MLKPSSAMNRTVLDWVDVRPEQAIMINDHTHHAEAARSVGLHAVPYEGADQWRSGLPTSGVLSL
ncbi:hypothetical protein E7T06_05455 [Deinococcus sp. Arct2-2]|uniref:hypothetical protein n=1 Tax=Deinococcus sp. Arct2-2 TaxID=2568653 RepID=UPI0010A2C450|nr:hypothetical protein [Deinococcus sp. Arct2-2]THF70799.1 hypothetical protein E7T06_05455 [Deinococcus sp. Arct2-2]